MDEHLIHLISSRIFLWEYREISGMTIQTRWDMAQKNQNFDRSSKASSSPSFDSTDIRDDGEYLAIIAADVARALTVLVLIPADWTAHGP
jgi:hypothetical protein